MLIYFHWEKKSISSKLSFQSYRLLLYVLYVLHVNWNQRIKICLNKILKELGWSKLANRRTNHRLVYFYKILNNLAPKYLKRLCNLTSHNTNNYLLRRNNSFLLPTIHVHRESFSKSRERSCSVVECLTRDRRAAGSSLTGVTALWSLSKTHLS